MTKYSDLLLLDVESASVLVPRAKERKKLRTINLTKLKVTDDIFPRIAELVPRSGDYAIFESTGDIVKFTGTLDHRKVNEIRIRQIPPWIKE